MANNVCCLTFVIVLTSSPIINIFHRSPEWPYCIPLAVY